MSIKRTWLHDKALLNKILFAFFFPLLISPSLLLLHPQSSLLSSPLFPLFFLSSCPLISSPLISRSLHIFLILPPPASLQHRSEVLSVHIPSNEDEWMTHEMKVLTDFTRIFPSEKRSVSMLSEDQEGDEEMEGVHLVTTALCAWIVCIVYLHFF